MFYKNKNYLSKIFLNKILVIININKKKFSKKNNLNI